MHIYIKRLRTIDIMYIVLLALVFFPGVITGIYEIYRIMLLLQCIVAAVLVADLCLHYRSTDIFIVLVLVFYARQFIATALYNTQYISTGLREILCSLSMILCFRRILIYEKYTGLINISRLFTIYIVFNFFQIIFMPYLFSPASTSKSHILYFLGIQNQMGQQLIPMCAIVMCISYCKKEKKSIFMIAILLFTIFSEMKVGSATGMVAGFVLLIGYFLIPFWDERKFNVGLLTGGYTIVSLILIVFQTVMTIPVFANFIQNVLKKDVTFSNRTAIWAQSLLRFQQSPLLGIGRQSGKSVMTFQAINQYDISTSYSAHNVFLQTIVESGIVGLIPIVILIILTAKRVRIINGKYTRVYLISLSSVLTSFLMEAFDLTFFFIILAILFYQNYFEKIIIGEGSI